MDPSAPIELAWDKGPLPCVVQDWRTGEVLTVAYMDREALRRTRESGEMWFWSRSRQELWHKGETSGNVQRLRELRWDCDADTLLAAGRAGGPGVPHRASAPASTTGTWSPPRARPWARSSGRSASAARTRPRAAGPRACSPIPRLREEKVLEEAEEVTRAAREESDERVAEEAADVLYHLAVLLGARGLSLTDAFAVLNDRRR